MGLLEVIALHAADAALAEEGGADRIELVSNIQDDGWCPEIKQLEEARKATSIQIRVMLRLRSGFSTDGAEITRLKGLISAYVDAGADGFVLGFLNGHSQIDIGVVSELISAGDWPWTFHRAIDYCLFYDKAWRVLAKMPRLDQVLTAGSARGVTHGLEDLIKTAELNPHNAKLIMAGGGLAAEHVPWLANAGVRSFHIGSPARPQGSYKAYVDPKLVRSWRDLIDVTVDRCESRIRMQKNNL